MIRITVEDTDTGDNFVIWRSKEELANNPIERRNFNMWYNIKIAGFITKALGKNKKSMKDLDKGK